MSETTKIAAAQEQLIKDIESKGIVHVLEWINGWYAVTASARLDDAIENALGEHQRDREGLRIFLMRELASEAPLVFNRSSQDGPNLMRQAYVAEIAARLRKFGTVQLDTDWSAFCARVHAQQSA